MIRLLFVVLLLTSCGPAAKLRRAEKLIAKAEEQGAKWSVDSVVVEIPVPVESVRVDTVLRVKVGDTVVIQKDRLKTIIRRIPGDTIILMTECEADTIRVKQTVTINKTIKAKGWLRWWHLLIAGLAGAGLIALIRR